ncbi:MAG: LD-carboxypeptidase [Kiritimatiellae bacterium]|nr:LD-carboxypeptidase [Kiritimatiellia bacterium]
MNIATIGIVSISSIISPTQLDLGTNALVQAGYRVKVAPNVAGPEVAPAAERARILERFWLDPEIDMLLFSRGGEGADEVVPLLDWDALRARPDLPVVGFSDVTILLNAMLAKGVGHPISGPMLSYAGRLTPEARDWFRRVMSGAPLPPMSLDVLRAADGGEVSGFPMGGHATRLHWLWKQGLAPSAAGRIVFIECTARHKAPDVIAGLREMADGGFFDGASAVILCDFRHTGEERAALDAFFPSFAASLTCSVFAGFPYGHVPGIRALDFRRKVAISADGVMR